jgi:hypothetical protein
MLSAKVRPIIHLLGTGANPLVRARCTTSTSMSRPAPWWKMLFREPQSARAWSRWDVPWRGRRAGCRCSSRLAHHRQRQKLLTGQGGEVGQVCDTSGLDELHLAGGAQALDAAR